MNNPYLPYGLNLSDLFESTSLEDLKDVKLLNASWKNLKDFSKNPLFQFDAVKKDEKTGEEIVDQCTDHMGNRIGDDPAYSVSFYGSHRSDSGVNISFYRCGSTSDNPSGFGPQVFLGVQKAMYDYIMAREPFALSWGPVYRSTNDSDKGKGVEASNVRGRVYDLYSKTHFFPDRYVSTEINRWVRRDIYDKFYIKNGYPEIPENLTKASKTADKNRFLTHLRTESTKVSQENRYKAQAEFSQFSKEEREKERLKLTAEKVERLRVYLDDAEKNPNRLKLGDIVALPDDLPELYKAYINDHFNYDSYRNLLLKGHDYGKIVDIDYESLWEGGDKELLVAKVNFVTDANDDTLKDSFTGNWVKIPLEFLKKHEEEHRKGRVSARLKKYMDDPALNPNGYKIDDQVICFFAFEAFEGSSRGTASSFMNYGQVGTIRYMDIDTNRLQMTVQPNDENVIRSEIPDWLQESLGNRNNRAFTVRATDKDLVKKTEENVNEVNQVFEKYVELNHKVMSGENPWNLELKDKVVSTKRNDFTTELESSLTLGQVGRVEGIKFDSRNNVYFLDIDWKLQNVLSSEEKFDLFPVLKSSRSGRGSFVSRNQERHEDKFLKFTPENLEEVKKIYKNQVEKFENAIASQDRNPEGLRVGEKVIFARNGRGSSTSYGLTGKISNIEPVRSSMRIELMAVGTIDGSIFDNQEIPTPPQNEFKIPLKGNDYIRLMILTPANILAVKNDMHIKALKAKRDDQIEKLGKLRSRHATGYRSQPYTDPEEFHKGDSVSFIDHVGKEFKAIVGDITTINDKKYAVVWIDSKIKYPPSVIGAKYDRGVYRVPLDILKRDPVRSEKLRRRGAYIRDLDYGRDRPNSLTAGFGIGDNVVVTQGVHQNKAGHIMSWRPTRSGVPRAVIQIYTWLPTDNVQKIEVPVNFLQRDDSVPRLEHQLNLLRNLKKLIDHSL